MKLASRSSLSFPALQSAILPENSNQEGINFLHGPLVQVLCHSVIHYPNTRSQSDYTRTPLTPFIHMHVANARTCSLHQLVPSVSNQLSSLFRPRQRHSVATKYIHNRFTYLDCGKLQLTFVQLVVCLAELIKDLHVTCYSPSYAYITA